MTGDCLVIACGAIAHELTALRRHHGWQHMKIQCLPAELHNTPEKIPGAVEGWLRKAHERDLPCFVAYADCGTGGQLDRVLQRYNVERLPGAHCYEFFAGHEAFAQMSENCLGTFYLTDFLARHFHRLIVRGFKLDRYPELREMMFGHYEKVVYLSQKPTEALRQHARQAADFLDLPLEEIHTGYGLMQTHLQRRMQAEPSVFPLHFHSPGKDSSCLN